MAPLNDTQKRYLELMRHAAATGTYRGRAYGGPEEDRGLIMTALDYVNRPYSAGSGAIAAMQRGNSPVGPFLKGLKGEEDYSGADIIGNVVDPYGEGKHDAAKRWGGLLWDLTVGNVYDPLSYLTFGSSTAGKALQKAKSGLDTPIAEGALKGLTKWPGRTEAARRGAKAWSVIRAQGKVPFTKLAFDLPLTPRMVNVPAARALDWTGDALRRSKAYQGIRRAVGGWRYTVDREYPGLSSFIADRRLRDKEDYKRILEQLTDMAKKYPEEARKAATYIAEMPELLDAQGRVMLHLPQTPTLDDYKKFAQEMRPHVEVPVTATRLHQQRALRETQALRDSIMQWHDEAGGLRTIDTEELEAVLFGQGAGMASTEQPGWLLEKMIDEADPNFSPERLIHAYLVDAGELPHDFGGMPEFIGIFGQDEWAELQGKYLRKRESVRVPVWEEVPVLDDAGNPVRRTKGKKKGQILTQKQVAVDEAGNVKYRTKRTGGQAEFLSRVKRYAEKKAARSEGALLPGLASDLAGGETGTAYILYRHPGHSSLMPGLQNIGGMGPLNVRQERVMGLLDKIDDWVRRGGNTLELSEAIVGKDEAAIKAIIKSAGLPDTKTTRNVLEAVHYNIWAGAVYPGRFSEHAKMLADEILGEVVLEPHQRYAHTQQKLKQLHQELLEEQERILRGGWNPPPRVAPDADEFTREALQPWQQRLNEYEFVEGGTRADHRAAVQVAVERGYDVPADVLAEYADEPWAAEALARYGGGKEAGESLVEQTAREGLGDTMRRGGGQSQAWFDEYADAAPITQNSRLEQIQEEIAAIEEAMGEANPFDKAYFHKKMLEGQTRPSFGQSFRVEEVLAEEIGVTDAARAAYHEGAPILDETLYEMMKRIWQADPDANPPIEHYVPHNFKKSWSPLEALERQRVTRKATEDFAQARRMFWTEYGLKDSDLIEEIVNREVRDHFGLNKPEWAKKAGRGRSENFLYRKYRYSMLELEHAGFKMPFEQDFPTVINDAVRTRMNWCYGYDLYDYAMKNYARRIENLTPEIIHAERLVPIDYFVPFIDDAKSPFKGWYIPKDLDNVLQGMLHLQHELTSDTAFKGIMEYVAGVRRWWSSWTLLPFPAFHARNLGSDLMLAAQADAKPWTRTGRLAFAAGAEVVGKDLPIAGKHLEKWDRLGKYVKELQKAFPNATVDDVMRIMKREEIIEGAMRDVDLLMQGAQLQMKTGTRLQRAAKEAAAWMPLHPDISGSKLLATTGRAGQRVQDFTRAGCFLDLLLQNSKIPGLKWEDAVDDAVKVTRKALFDYHDLTVTERHLLKNLIPFYTFTAKNIPRQLEVLFTEPKRFAYLARAYSGAWNTDDELFTRDMMPEWLKNAMGIPVRRKQTGDKSEWVVWSPSGWLPMTELNELAEMFRSPFQKGESQFDEAGKFWLSRLNPMFKEPLEQLMNYDSFAGQKIDSGEIRDVFGISVHPRIAHAARNIRFITEIDRLNPGGLFTKLGQVRGHWRDERPHRREPSGMYRGLRGFTGMSLYDQKPLKEMRNEYIRLKIEANKLRREARRSSMRGQMLEAEQLMGRARDKQAGMVRLRERVERFRQGRAREVEAQEKRKTGS